MKIFMHVLFVITFTFGGFNFGYKYATRHNHILALSIEWDKRSVETLERFSKLIEETDWCDK